MANFKLAIGKLLFFKREICQPTAQRKERKKQRANAKTPRVSPAKKQARACKRTTLSLCAEPAILDSMTQKQKKTVLAAACLAAYECVRLLAVITARPQTAAAGLPASWYASVPLLALPVLLAAGCASSAQAPLYRRLYSISKAMSMAGILLYIKRVLPLAAEYGAKNGYYTVRRCILLLIFFLIDCILMFSMCAAHRYDTLPADGRGADT